MNRDDYQKNSVTLEKKRKDGIGNPNVTGARYI